MTVDEIDLLLPRFTIRQEHDLGVAVRHLGIVAAWTDGARFDALSPEMSKVSDIGQEAVVEIEEEGVRAAAVTAIALLAAGAPLQEAIVAPLRSTAVRVRARRGQRRPGAVHRLVIDPGGA